MEGTVGFLAEIIQNILRDFPEYAWDEETPADFSAALSFSRQFLSLKT
ncbi:hypothetical protein ACP0HM_30685 [Escherichia coli]